LSGSGQRFGSPALFRRDPADNPFGVERCERGVEIPLKARQAIGLDDEPCWVIVSERNVDTWPNAGLQPIPCRPGVFAYRFIPPRLFAQIKANFLEFYRHGRRGRVRR
jgi:hypothetical protein